MGNPPTTLREQLILDSGGGIKKEEATPIPAPPGKAPAKSLREQLVADSSSSTYNPGGGGSAPKQDEHTFLGEWWKRANPFAGAKAFLWDMPKANWDAWKEFDKAHPDATWADKQKFQMGLAKDMFAGMLEAIPLEIAEIGSLDTAPRAGASLGLVTPFLFGRFLRRGSELVKEARVRPRVSRKGTKLQARAAERITEIRKTELPGKVGSPIQNLKNLKAWAEQTGRDSVVNFYRQYEALKIATRNQAQKFYRVYDRAVNHVNNEVGEGLVIRRARAMDPEGRVYTMGPLDELPEGHKLVSEAVQSVKPMHSPVNTEPFRAELDELIKMADSPGGFEKLPYKLQRFLQELGEQKGFDVIEYDKLKKGIGHLKILAEEGPGVTHDTTGLARRILDKAVPVLDDKITEIASKAEMSVGDVLDSMKKGDMAWRKFNDAFDTKKATEGIQKAMDIYDSEMAQLEGKPPEIPPRPDVTSVQHGASMQEEFQNALRVSTDMDEMARTQAAEQIAEFATANATNFDKFIQVFGPQGRRYILGSRLDYIFKNHKWMDWEKYRLSNLDVRMLEGIPGAEDLANNIIPAVFDELAELEKAYGTKAAANAVQAAFQELHGVASSPGAGAIIPGAHRISSLGVIASKLLTTPEWARRLLQTLRKYHANPKQIIASGMEAAPILGVTGGAHLSEENKKKVRVPRNVPPPLRKPAGLPAAVLNKE